MDEITVTFDESQRQATLLALAILSLQRPGWYRMLYEIADVLKGRVLFEEFRRLNSDRVKPL